MTQVAVCNSVPLSMTDGATTITRIFQAPLVLPKSVKAGPALPEVVGQDCTLSGVAFTSSLLSVKTRARGVFLVLNGAVVTCTDGFYGTVTPAHCAGAGVDVN